MAVNVVLDNSDDPGFIELVNAVIRGVIASHAPQNVWIIRIDNWFDHKWLTFSGNGLVSSNIPLDRWDTVKAEFHRDKVTFPPFTPNRVVNQFSYARFGDEYSEVPSLSLPHSTERQHSDENLNRRVQDFSESAIFVWFSGNTVANGRGSIMVYKTNAAELECWFAALERNQCSWELTATKGVSRREIESFLEASQ